MNINREAIAAARAAKAAERAAAAEASKEAADAAEAEAGAHKGSRLLARHRAGAPLTRAEAMCAKCADCMADYADGRADCKVPTCPLYPWMPYRKGTES